ncbi:pentatricopeptide repeat-containing protein At3g04130, mitochondrial-like [Aristolochia californica]|uniref:pentatricopeptide repeat-containing protein At3g04130, mitochondrial-like n=1 Tax=Aristolochia californica TaxID=171875 RepID=UPI0035D9763E
MRNCRFPLLISCCRSSIIDTSRMRHSKGDVFIFASISCPFTGALIGIQYHACSPSLVPLEKVVYSSTPIKTTCHMQRAHTLVNAPYLSLEENDSINKILSVIPKFHCEANEDKVLQSLLRNEVCCRIQPSKHLVSDLLKRFEDDWKSALGFFRWAASQPAYDHSAAAYDKMIDILGKMKRIDKMWQLVDEMRGNGLITLNTVAKIMRRLAGAGRWEEAIKTFDDLELLGVRKDVESMNILLDTLCKEKKVQRAREVFLELKVHIPPNAYTFTIFIHGWCKVRRIDEAQWTVLEMKGHGFRPCVIAYSTIVQAYCDQFNFRKVYDLLDEMQAEGCPPNVVTYTSIMHSLAKSEEIEEALQIFERMKAVQCKPDTHFYNSLIYILGKAGQVSKAVRIFEDEMCNNGVFPTVSTYNTLISIFCHHSQLENAFEVLNEMESSVSCEPDLLTYHPLLKLCLRTGQTKDKLRKLLDDMVNKHHICLDLGTYTLLIHGLCHVGECEWAYFLFCEMISKDITPRYKTCNLLLEAVEKKNMYDAVENIKTCVKQMKNNFS